MSVWTQISGTCVIPKKEKISLKDIFDTETTENILKVETTDDGVNYHHQVNVSIELDYYEIKNFLSELPNLIKCKECDFDISTRIII